MNYRLLLSEMLIDYFERREKTKCGKTYKVYNEVINDLKLALEIEPNQIAIVNEANKLLNSTECNITPVVESELCCCKSKEGHSTNKAWCYDCDKPTE